MKIISIEGPDGVGKSTQSSILARDLRKKGYKVYQEHFPRYNTPIGELIKNILNGNVSMPQFDALQMLYAADQTDFRDKIEQLMKEGYDYLILDRYMVSTIVYYCSKMNNNSSYKIVEKWQEGIVNPDITIVLSSSELITDKGKYKELDEFEKDSDFMSKIARNYIHFANTLKNPKIIEVVSANGTINNVANNIKNKLLEYKII